MMQFNAASMKALVFDYGNHIKVAEKLGAEFETVYYFNPNVHDGFQEKRDALIGQGVKGIIKVKEWASIIDQVGFVMFCDCYEPDLQDYFRSQGKLVFGSGQSSVLETDRVLGKRVLEQLGLPIGEYEIAYDVDDLEMKMRDKEGYYIKSNFRGNFETTRWTNWRVSSGEIRRIKKGMGAFGNNEIYVIEKKIPSLGEIGSDFFCVNGEYSNIGICGMEKKDAAYCCRFVPYNFMPRQIKKVMESMGKKFSELGYNGWYSNEIIVGEDKEGYLLDSTCRMPSPPSGIILNNITNFSQCVLNVAAGIVPQIEFKYEYCVELIIKSDVAAYDDTPLVVPEEYQPYVSIKNLYVDGEGTWFFAKRNGVVMQEIGSIFGGGSSVKEAKKMAKKIWDSIQSEDARVDFNAVDEAYEELTALSRHGIKIL